MSYLLASYTPFPPVTWFARLYGQHVLMLDAYEHFEKMSLRNRYAITGANGKILLSIPLVKGRNQRTAMKDVMIFNGENWQQQHWRTLMSVYRRSPYFEHFEPELQHFYLSSYSSLTDFNEQTIRFLLKQFGMPLNIQFTQQYKANYAPPIQDMRGNMGSEFINEGLQIPSYTQIFSERNGFLHNLSALDLLFSQGPMAASYLKNLGNMLNDSGAI